MGGYISQNLWDLITGVGSLDIHIFHDKDKEKISHLNIQHTVTIDVISNTTVTFPSS